MTDAPTVAAKLDKLSLNMDRFDTIINGSSDAEVVTDGGTVPTVAKALSTLTGAESYAATGSPWVRRQGDRARDFVHLGDWLPGAGHNLAEGLAAAVAALDAKGGGYLRLENYMQSGTNPILLDTIGGQYILNTDSIRLEGEGNSTVFISSRAAGPIISIGDGSRLVQKSGLGNFRISATAANFAGAACRVYRAYESMRENVVVEFPNTTPTSIGSGGIICTCFSTDGGSDGYNNRERGIRGYGNYNQGLVVGTNGRVQGGYLDEIEFGGARDSGVLLFDASGVMFGAGECLACGYGVKTFPGPGQLVVAVFSKGGMQLDSCFHNGLALFDNGGYVENWEWRSWITSSGLSPTIEGVVQAPDCNVKIVGSGAANSGISRIHLHDCIMGAAGSHSMVTQNCRSIRADNCMMDGSGILQTAAGWFMGNGTVGAVMNGGSARGQWAERPTVAPAHFPVSLAYIAEIDASTDYCFVSGHVDGRGTTTGSITSFSTGTHNQASFTSGVDYIR